jgi:hypothetical protein
MFGEFDSILYSENLKEALERPRRRWEGDIKMYLREMGWETVAWILLCQHGNQ